MSGLPQALEAALAATSAALEARDDVAAAEAARRAAEICAGLAASGEPLPPPLRDRALALQARCDAAAARRLADLTVELDAAARSRRAADAYRR